MKNIGATSRTVEALHKADAIPRNEVCGMPRAKPGSYFSGGAGKKWAEVTAVTDANTYTCDIWGSRSSYYNGDDPATEGASVLVPKIVDELGVGNDFGVEKTTVDGFDYICTEQLGALG